MKPLFGLLSCVALAVPLIACGNDEDESAAGGGRGGTGGRPGGSGGGGNAGIGGIPGAGGVPGAGGASVRPYSVAFEVRIENVSAGSPLETPISPGAWVTHAHDNVLFEDGKPDYDSGLEAIAEDGNPEKLDFSLRSNPFAKASGTFDTAAGAIEPGPALPGSAFEFTVKASPGDKLSFATMLAQSNDVFLAPPGAGIPLFDQQGKPLLERDVTPLVATWNAGTEHDQAPGMGPDQAPRQAVPNTGPAEGVVWRFSQPTRAIPSPRAIVGIDVSETGGAYTITLNNMSREAGVIDTPISPVFAATHDDNWRLFQPGTHASAGLERLAEDGSPALLVAEHSGVHGIGTVTSVAVPDGKTVAGPAMSGESFTFSVVPDPAYRFLSLATMVGDSNDAFIATPPDGVALLDAEGELRDPAEIQADLKLALATWDAGTEANQPSGVGLDQAPRQPSPNTGAADPNDTVRLYADATNDLAGPSLGGFATVGVVRAANGEFVVTLTNTSQNTVYPGALSPVLFLIHDGGARLFEKTQPASVGLERLAEDGNAFELLEQLSNVASAANGGIIDTALGQTTAGPLMPGQSYVFTVAPDSVYRYLDIASMVVPSNDTFLAFEPGGVALIDPTGAPRSDAAIATDIAARLAAWDAGTELNQAAAAGPDQAPRQKAPNTGPSEGDRTVRPALMSAWPFPETAQLIRVSVRPLR